MSMNRTEKEQQVSELHEKFSSCNLAILIEFNGLDVAEITELRKRLRGTQSELRIIKNTLALRAAEGTHLAVPAEVFQGPTAVTFGYADPTPTAKVLKEFADKRADKIKFKVGLIEGQILDPNALKRVASLPKKEVLLADLVRRLQFPITGWVGGLHGILRKLVFVVAAVRDKQGTT